MRRPKQKIWLLMRLLIGFSMVAASTEFLWREDAPQSKTTDTSHASKYEKIWVKGPRGIENIEPTLRRIKKGQKHPHHNDGDIFANHEGLLPKKKHGYYREYVHDPDPRPGPGPQRIVVGEGGDTYYTPNHYQAFEELPSP